MIADSARTKPNGRAAQPALEQGDADAEGLHNVLAALIQMSLVGLAMQRKTFDPTSIIPLRLNV